MFSEVRCRPRCHVILVYARIRLHRPFRVRTHGYKKQAIKCITANYNANTWQWNRMIKLNEHICMSFDDELMSSSYIGMQRALDLLLYDLAWRHHI
jgi:hypothetical protein